MCKSLAITLLTQYLQSSRPSLALTSAQKLHRVLHGRGFQGQAAPCIPTSPSTMPSVEWCGIKHAATGLWIRGNMFCGVTYHTPLSDQSDRSLGLVNIRTTPARLHCANCKFWGRRDKAMGFCGTTLGKALFCSSMTVRQYTKQGP